MSSVKALKKLKKSTSKKTTRSLSQLKKLRKASHNQKTKSGNRVLLQSDLKSLSNKVLMDVAAELIAPANPLLSWFGTSSYALGSNMTLDIRSVVPSPSVDNDSARSALAAIPMKTPSCKKCPALGNGLCKCAVKKFNITS